MNLTTPVEAHLASIGFARQPDLGRSPGHALDFFCFLGETFAFDEEGVPWTRQGRLDPGDYFRQCDPVLWETAA